MKTEVMDRHYDRSLGLRLVPVHKSRTFMDSVTVHPYYRAQRYGPPNTSTGLTKYPRIIVRDRQGRCLDTFTTLQDAIYRASWNRKQNKEWPKDQLEWRLPKAPVPSKPDFSRAGQIVTGHLHKGTNESVSTAVSHGGPGRIDLTTNLLIDAPTLEIPVDDVAFVAESLNHLPSLPSFSFLRHSILAGSSAYVQIVTSIILHQKQISARDQRSALWEFPGFCNGCKRAGLCYGCGKNSLPHVHEDIPAMTGGGFRFYRRDRPRDTHNWKNPLNWSIPESDEELKYIIEKYGGLAAYEKAVVAASRELAMARRSTFTEDRDSALESEKTQLQRITQLGTYPPYVTIVTTDDFYDSGEEDGDSYSIEKEKHDTNIVENELEALRGRERQRKSWNSGKVTTSPVKSRSPESKSSKVLSKSSETGSVRIDTGFDEYLVDEDRDDDVDGTVSRGNKTSVSIVEPSEHGENIDAEGQRSGTRVSGSVRTRSVSTTSRRRSVSQTNSDGRDRKESTVTRSSSVSQDRPTAKTSVSYRSKEDDLDEIAMQRKKKANENVPFGKKRKDVNYKPPVFFTVKKKSRQATVSKDPFSTERSFDIPKGGSFVVKKTDRKTTQFMDFRKSDKSWTPPKKFEIKKENNKGTKFWTPPARTETTEDKRRRKKMEEDAETLRQQRQAALDAKNNKKKSQNKGQERLKTKGLKSGDGSEEKNASDEKDKENDDNEAGISEGLDNEGDNTGVDNDGDENDEQSNRPKRREIIKKVRGERQAPPTPTPSPPRLPSPPLMKKRSPPPPTPPTPTRTPTPDPVELKLPELDLPVVPGLPEIEQREREKRKQRQKFAVEAPPGLQEAPKKRRAAPKIRLLPKNLYKARRTKPGEAPVSAEDIQDIQDPLDFLAKYCIINQDRLPFYELIFEATLAEQTPRYMKVSETKKAVAGQEADQNEADENGTQNQPEEGKKSTKKGKKRKKSKERKEKKGTEENINNDLLEADRGMALQKLAMSVEEQHLEKLLYTLDLLQHKMYLFGEQLDQLEAIRTKELAEKTRIIFPEICAPDYVPKKKKGKKKNKKDSQPKVKLRASDVTDELIVSRLDDKMMTELCKDEQIRHTEVEIWRIKDKMDDIQARVEKLAQERLLADAFCMNHFFQRQGLGTQTTDDFRRQQSELYNRLRPTPDFEMNLEEVEGALQQINNHLLTEKELHFLYNILNLPGRHKINFRLFTIIAALSEKVTQLDPVIRKLINNVNYNALDIKMEKCKELFELLDADCMPKGGAQASSLAVELTAGGLKPEHTNYVLHKFNRESRGVIDFLDFVTYVPLFVEIHKRIIVDPLREELDL